MLRRVVGWIVVIGLVVWFVGNPAGAANLAQEGLRMLQNAGDSLTTFANSFGG